MTIADDMAFPMFDGTSAYAGVSKREYFAAMAMQGLCSASMSGTAEEFTEAAVSLADALIKTLNKEQ